MKKKKPSKKTILESKVVLEHPVKGQLTVSLHDLRQILYDAEQKYRERLPE